MKAKVILPLILVAVFALSRWPGLMPLNFSAAYAIAFCAGVYFPRKMAWWLPLLTLLATDLALNCFYQFSLGYDVFTPGNLLMLGGNYIAYAVLIWLGKKFTAKSSFVALLGGGILGALLFYFVTNTLSWLLNPFHNPEYTKTMGGLFWALTKGTAGWPETWEFFRNTLLSGGIFSGLFIGAMKFEEKLEAEEEETTESEEEPAAEGEIG